VAEPVLIEICSLSEIGIQNSSSRRNQLEGQDCGQLRSPVSRVKVRQVRCGAGHQDDELSTSRQESLVKEEGGSTWKL